MMTSIILRAKYISILIPICGKWYSHRFVLIIDQITLNSETETMAYAMIKIKLAQPCT